MFDEENLQELHKHYYHTVTEKLIGKSKTRHQQCNIVKHVLLFCSTRSILCGKIARALQRKIQEINRARRDV